MSWCERCGHVAGAGQATCSWCLAELADVCLLRCAPEQLGRFIRRLFTRRNGTWMLRRRQR